MNKKHDVALVQRLMSLIKVRTKFGPRPIWSKRIDGRYTREMEPAIMCLQEHMGMKPTGKLEPTIQTLNALTKVAPRELRAAASVPGTTAAVKGPSNPGRESYLHENGLTIDAAITLINRFLSVMTFCSDQFAITGHGWAGNRVPYPIKKSELAFSTAHNWVFHRKIPESEMSRIALALYREARNAQQNNLVSYAVLGYYKIIELKYEDGKKTKKWFQDNFEQLTPVGYLANTVKLFLEVCGQEEPHEYIHKACRIAVAHARPRQTNMSDPDDTHELRRLYIAADILKELARLFIREELAVSEIMFDGS